MSQNAVLDRETINAETHTALATETQPVTRSQHEHLTLVDWGRAANSSRPLPAAKAFAPVTPARRPWFGLTEVYTGLLLLAAGAACLSSLLHI